MPTFLSKINEFVKGSTGYACALRIHHFQFFIVGIFLVLLFIHKYPIFPLVDMGY